MNAQKKETEEITKITESLSSNPTPKKRSKSLSRIVKPILITSLAVLCLTGGIVLHKIHAFEKQHLNQKPTYSLRQERPFSLTMGKTSTPQTPIKLFNTSPQNEVENTSLPSPENNVLSLNNPFNEIKTEETLSPETITEEQNTQDEQQALSQEKSTPQIDGFSLSDALLFKEHFLTEESCYEDYQKLLNVSNKTFLANDVLNNLSPYCLSNQSAIKNVRSAFLKNKKKALIVYYKENNPSWLAYLKAIPASLIEIRKINPTKNNPKDILYSAQNEIDSQNISKAIDLITKLPLTMQQKMTDFYREAAIYNRAKNSIDQLILSFEVKGE